MVESTGYEPMGPGRWLGLVKYDDGCAVKVDVATVQEGLNCCARSCSDSGVTDKDGRTGHGKILP